MQGAAANIDRRFRVRVTACGPGPGTRARGVRVAIVPRKRSSATKQPAASPPERILADPLVYYTTQRHQTKGHKRTRGSVALQVATGPGPPPCDATRWDAGVGASATQVPWDHTDLRSGQILVLRSSARSSLPTPPLQSLEQQQALAAVGVAEWKHATHTGTREEPTSVFGADVAVLRQSIHAVTHPDGMCAGDRLIERAIRNVYTHAPLCVPGDVVALHAQVANSPLLTGTVSVADVYRVREDMVSAGKIVAHEAGYRPEDTQGNGHVGPPKRAGTGPTTVAAIMADLRRWCGVPAT